MTPQYASKVDKHHAEIRKAARKVGYKWYDIFRAGDGMPDALVLSKSNRWITFEIKSKGEGLTPKEFKFMNSLPLEAPHYVIVSINDFLAAMNLEDA